jgi:Leucine-rich repeat (LRR) protein
MSLSNNQLRGSIPTGLGSLPNLQELLLDNNQLSGSIPVQLGNLAHLRWLSLNNNQLSSGIPQQLGNLTNLQGLDLRNNQLTGTIPDTLANLSNLQYLSLSNNQLSGAIPGTLSSLTNLQILWLNDNLLSGAIPLQLGDLVSLQRLNLAYNQLSGGIPLSLGNLINLTEMSLSHNQLSGAIPVQLGNLTNLQYFSIRNNQITGNIPQQLGNLTALRSLDIDVNSLSGVIPAQLGNLVNLEWLWLSNNQLSGSIPDQLGNLTSLQALFLYNNQLSGTIPLSFQSLANLQYFWFGGNSQLCEPYQVSFQNWLATLYDLQRSGNICPTPTPTDTPTPTPTPTDTPTPTPTPTSTATPTVTPTPQPLAIFLPSVQRAAPPMPTPAPQWQRIGTESLDLRSVAWNPAPRHLYVANRSLADQGGGIYRRTLASCDLSTDFERVIPGRGNSLAFNSGRGLAGTYGDKVYFTHDGQTWQQTASQIDARVYSVEWVDSEWAFAGMEDGVYASRDRGISWQRFGDGMPTVLVVKVYAGELWIGRYGEGIYKSPLGSPAFTPVNQGLDGQARNVFDFAFSGSTVFIGTDDGVYAWQGSAWSRIGLAATPVYSLELFDNHLYAGTLNAGVQRAPLANLGAWSSLANGSGWNPNATVRDLQVIDFGLPNCNGGLMATTETGLWIYRSPN